MKFCVFVFCMAICTVDNDSGLRKEIEEFLDRWDLWEVDQNKRRDAFWKRLKEHARSSPHEVC